MNCILLKKFFVVTSKLFVQKNRRRLREPSKDVNETHIVGIDTHDGENMCVALIFDGGEEMEVPLGK